MAYQKTYCSEPTCIKHLEYRGGRFRNFNGKWFCEDCAEIQGVMNAGKDLWNFTTKHLNGEPIKIKNLAHLRQLEKQFGVSNQAANYDERHWDVTPTQHNSQYMGNPREFGKGWGSNAQEK